MTWVDRPIYDLDNKIRKVGTILDTCEGIAFDSRTLSGRLTSWDFQAALTDDDDSAMALVTARSLEISQLKLTNLTPILEDTLSELQEARRITLEKLTIANDSQQSKAIEALHQICWPQITYDQVDMLLGALYQMDPRDRGSVKAMCPTSELILKRYLPQKLTDADISELTRILQEVFIDPNIRDGLELFEIDLD